MISNDPSNLMRAIARDTGVSLYLVRQTVHEDIWYLSWKIHKGQQDTALCHMTVAWLSDNFSSHISLDTWPQNSSNCSPIVYYICYEVERYQFKQRDRPKELQDTPKSSGGRGWCQLWFYWITVLFSISRYFYVILKNISVKMKCRSYFNFLRNLDEKLPIVCAFVYLYDRYMEHLTSDFVKL